MFVSLYFFEGNNSQNWVQGLSAQMTKKYRKLVTVSYFCKMTLPKLKCWLGSRSRQGGTMMHISMMHTRFHIQGPCKIYPSNFTRLPRNRVTETPVTLPSTEKKHWWNWVLRSFCYRSPENVTKSAGWKPYLQQLNIHILHRMSNVNFLRDSPFCGVTMKSKFVSQNYSDPTGT